MRILFFAPILLFLSQNGFAQTYTTTKTTSEKALSAFNEGRAEADRGQHAVAQGYFEKALRADPRFIDAKLALADNYAELRDYFKAEKHFEEALALDSVYAPVAFLFLAKTEWELGKYDECVGHIQSYLCSQPKNERNKRSAERLLASAQFAAKAVKNPVAFNPLPVGDSINTKWNEYFPSLTADGEVLIFTRRDLENDENFYRSELHKGVWTRPEPLAGVNTPDNEGAQAISPDGSWLIFTGCNREGDGSQGACDLYWSQLRKNGWTKPVPFSSIINSPDWDAQPTIGADNKTVIFTSNRPGTRGSMDLWQTTRGADGKWGKPENLGPTINTPGKDHTPFLHPDGQTLFFASDSLPGMGGSDIFFSRRQPDGAWGAPQNLGYPINTGGEEGMLVVSLDGRRAYFASDRPGGKGGLDLYTFELPEFARPQPVTYAKAQVTDAATGYPITAKVEFTDVKSGKVFVSATTKSDGTFLVCLPAGKEYGLNVSKDKYLFFSENFNLEGSASFEKPFLLDIELQPIGADASAPIAGKPVVLRNVFFETGSAALRAESLGELDRLALLLQESPGLKIQINGHTDQVGDEASNQNLSEQRARSVWEYLRSKGITEERLRYKGFGESRPIESNDTPEGRARNRRTEFEVWK
jgi:outer membrane protein OmpA-like peptidoglycan-associated protein/predicted negative regulator of RcsB-dependent stress response